MLTIEQLKQYMYELEPIVKNIDDDQITVLFRFLSERISYPESFVVMLGETSSGKTSIVNSLLQQDILGVSAAPNTGTVIEIMNDPDITSPEYYALHRNATLEQVTKQEFDSLCTRPESHHSRLRLFIPSFPSGVEGLRLFDTPGYGSLHKEHDEVLKEFIPNSDIVIYVVSYRVGFQAGDYEFLRYVGELLDSSTNFILVINRAPKPVMDNDLRVQEILGYTADCLHRKPVSFVLQSVGFDEKGEKPYIETGRLWEYIQQSLESEQRQRALQRALANYQYEFSFMLQTWLEKEVLRNRATQAEKEAIARAVIKISDKEKDVHNLICTTFAKLSNKVESIFANAAANSYAVIASEVTATDKWTMQEECTAFIQQHMLPRQARIRCREIEDYFVIELEDLDKQINSMLNTAMEEFDTEIKLEAPLFEPLVRNIGQKAAKHLADEGLKVFFARFGGAGGAGAGVANAAKAGLKNIGELVGKKFSRETHNAVAVFLKKIGATSTRAIAIAGTVIVEVVFYTYDANTWQKKLIEKIDEALKDWTQEVVVSVRKDLSSLRDYNLMKTSEYFREASSISYNEEEILRNLESNQLQNLIEDVQSISQRLRIEIEVED